MTDNALSLTVAIADKPDLPALQRVELRIDVPASKAASIQERIGRLVVIGQLQDAGDVGLYLSGRGKITLVAAEKPIVIEAVLNQIEVGFGLGEDTSTFDVKIISVEAI